MKDQDEEGAMAMVLDLGLKDYVGRAEAISALELAKKLADSK